MNQLARHGNSTRTLQARTKLTTLGDDEKTLNRHKPPLGLKQNEQATLNVEILSLVYNKHTGDHDKAIFALNNGKPR